MHGGARELHQRLRSEQFLDGQNLSNTRHTALLHAKVSYCFQLKLKLKLKNENDWIVFKKGRRIGKDAQEIARDHGRTAESGKFAFRVRQGHSRPLLQVDWPHERRRQHPSRSGQLIE